jgi:RND family efflux transporter MFP subunit
MNRAAVLQGLTFAPLLLAACGAPAPPEAALPAVLVHTVVYGAAQAIAVYPGEIRARHETDLAFRIAGKILARPVDAGAAVGKGQVLARLDPQDVKLAAEAARAQLAAAETDLRFAEAELRRSESLLARRFISQTAFDAKRTSFDAARARLDQARAQGAVAQNQEAYAELVADRAGVITAALAEPGQVVAAGQPVLRLAEPGEKEAWITVPENRLAELRQAPRLEVSLWAAPDRKYAARVREVAAVADPVTRSFQVKLSLPDADEALRLGMSANVALAGAAARREARLPAPALGSREGRPVVWVAGGEGEVQPRPVEVLRYAKDGVIVGAGLEDGERVVAAGVHKLVAGQKVAPQPAPRPVDPPR